MPDSVSFPSGAVSIGADLYVPAGKASAAAIVIAYGADGLTDDLAGPWETMIRGYAEKLSKAGFFALIPDYLSKTGTAPGPVARQMMFEPNLRRQWEDTLLDAVTYCRAITRVGSSGIGLLGFSLGGHLCLRIRAAAAPKALVEFFAPVLSGIGPPGVVPNAEIHHGKDDKLPVTLYQFAESIKSTLISEGTATTLHGYPGAGHGFIGNDAANKSAATTSQTRTLSFFSAHL